MIRMAENVRKATIEPWIERTIAKESVVYMDEYGICSRLDE
jgi:hypothetical protein